MPTAIIAAAISAGVSLLVAVLGYILGARKTRVEIERLEVEIAQLQEARLEKAREKAARVWILCHQALQEKRSLGEHPVEMLRTVRKIRRSLEDALPLLDKSEDFERLQSIVKALQDTEADTGVRFPEVAKLAEGSTEVSWEHLDQALQGQLYTWHEPAGYLRGAATRIGKDLESLCSDLERSSTCHCEPLEGRRSNLQSVRKIASGASRPRKGRQN